jgi:hypothetical protein
MQPPDPPSLGTVLHLEPVQQKTVQIATPPGSSAMMREFAVDDVTRSKLAVQVSWGGTRYAVSLVGRSPDAYNALP